MTILETYSGKAVIILLVLWYHHRTMATPITGQMIKQMDKDLATLTEAIPTAFSPSFIPPKSNLISKSKYTTRLKESNSKTLLKKPRYFMLVRKPKLASTLFVKKLLKFGQLQH